MPSPANDRLADDPSVRAIARDIHFGALIPCPDTRIIERPGWYQVVTPSAPDHLNEVVFSAFHEDADVDAELDAVIGEYRRLGVEMKWSVGPGSRPHDLGQRLAARGLRPWWARAMAVRPATWSGARPLPDEVSIAQVTADTLTDYVDAVSRGWNSSAVVIATKLAGVDLDGGRHRFFLAYDRGRPAGAASWLRQPGAGYMDGGVVISESRGRGLYRALVAARLASMRANGVSLAVTHAREATSAPILARLGFETLFRYEMYGDEPPPEPRG